ncbi:MAG: SIMPL domain-containing protein [Afipia sp.]|nr:SIMPL domain-containing protein [Afipia sp.]
MNWAVKHAALVAALVASPALAQVPPTSISVTGEAAISAIPDLAQIDGGVTNDAKTAREASEANNKAMGVILLALKSAGIPEKDFQTSQLSLQPQYALNKSGLSPITGFRATNRVAIVVRDVAKIGNVVDTLVTNGANDIGGISFTVSQSSKLLDDARSKAIADARRKAEIYAQAAGISLGAPLSISEESSPSPAAYRKMSAGIASPAPIAPGEETLRISVSVSYEIKPKSP